MVIEAATEVRSLHWKTPKLRTLDTLADGFFVRPQEVQSDIRTTFRQAVADVLLKAFLITLPLEHTSQDPAYLDDAPSVVLHAITIPPALSQHASSLRRLVLDQRVLLLRKSDLDIQLIGHSLTDMAFLHNPFPNLETCIFLLRIETTWSGRLHRRDVDATPVLVGILAAFTSLAPGKRKLIRLSLRGKPGPLVEAGDREFSPFEIAELRDGEQTGVVGAVWDNADRLFWQAYTFRKKPE